MCFLSNSYPDELLVWQKYNIGRNSVEDTNPDTTKDIGWLYKRLILGGVSI